jgi:hypothetical protein
MLDYTKYKPDNHAFFKCQIRIQIAEWMPIILALAAYAATMGIGYSWYLPR